MRTDRQFERLDAYLDSEKIELDGDIIITDPGYIVCEENGISDNDWKLCEYGENMEALGIKKYLSADTLYGNWSCTTFNADTESWASSVQTPVWLAYSCSVMFSNITLDRKSVV